MCQDHSFPEETHVQKSWACVTVLGMILAFCAGVLVGAIL